MIFMASLLQALLLHSRRISRHATTFATAQHVKWFRSDIMTQQTNAYVTQLLHQQLHLQLNWQKFLINVKLANGAIFPVVISDEIELRIARKNLIVRSHACEIAFAVTFHKIQGRTLDSVVLHLTKTSALRAQSVLVGMSRVRSAARMRLFPGDISHIRTKAWDPSLRSFFKRLRMS